jgi:hypothetical protein
MTINLLGNWQIDQEGEAERHFLYADAYLSASEAVSIRMQNAEGARTWPNASVALMLAAHSLELFLKGAIFLREPTAKTGHHRIDDLYKQYTALYPDSKFTFDPPFRTEYVGFSEVEIKALKKKQPLPSILYRYPVPRPGEEWGSVLAFDPDGFLAVLTHLRDDYGRIRGAI